MSTKTSLFPQKIDEQVSDLNTKQGYITSNAARFGVTGTELETMHERVTAVNTAHAAASNKDTRTRVDVAVRLEALRLAKADIRKIIEFRIAGNPNATEVDYEALSIPRPGHHSPLPAPEFVPGIGHISSSDLHVIVPFFDGKNNKHAKPAGVYAIEAYYQLGGEQPASIVSLTERATDTSSPLRIRFEFDDEFKIVYLAFRWIGTRGDYGPWSEIHKVAIAR